MSHPEADLLSPYIDGELSEREHVTLEAHLASCRECTEMLRAIRATLADLSAMPEPLPTEMDSARIRAAVARARAPRRQPRWAWLGGAAAAAVLALIGYAIVSRTSTTSTSHAGRSALAASPSSFANLTAKSADSLLQSFASRQEAGGSAKMVPAAPAPAHIQAYDAAQARCESAVRAGKQPDETDTARFKGEPVYLLFYSLPDRVELWVVARSSCVVRYFVQIKTH